MIIIEISNFRPHFSIPETLIRSIALSLPFEHTLIVKPHPHNYLTDDRLIEINLHYNVKLLHKKYIFMMLYQI